VTAFSELLETKGDLQQLIGQLEEAVELYRGDFLEGFSIPDSTIVSGKLPVPGKQ